jgi:hypothetical protein
VVRTKLYDWQFFAYMDTCHDNQGRHLQKDNKNYEPGFSTSLCLIACMLSVATGVVTVSAKRAPDHRKSKVNDLSPEFLFGQHHLTTMPYGFLENLLKPVPIVPFRKGNKHQPAAIAQRSGRAERVCRLSEARIPPWRILPASRKTSQPSPARTGIWPPLIPGNAYLTALMPTPASAAHLRVNG